MAFALCLSLAACSNSNPPENGSLAETSASEPASKFDTPDEPEMVTLTIPSVYFEEDELTEIVGDASSDNYESLTMNDDGSVTLVMTEKQHQAILAAVKESLISSAADAFPDDDCPSVKSMAFSDDFTEATLSVNYESYENSFDSLCEYTAIISCAIYQIFSGIDADNVSVTISVVDEESGEIKRSACYPEDYDTGDINSSDETAKVEASGDIGDYHVEIAGARKTTDWDGNPAIIITYSWTNNSEETTSALNTIREEAFQDGVSLEYALVDDELNDSSTDVRPGYTVDVDAVFTMTSNSVVEFELKDAMGEENNMVTMTFDPTTLDN